MNTTENLIISTPKNFYTKDDKIYKKPQTIFQKGITVLVSCNGSEKSTFLRMIEDICRTNKIPVWKYDNLSQGGASAEQSLFDGCGSGIKGYIEDMSPEEVKRNFENVKNVGVGLSGFGISTEDIAYIKESKECKISRLRLTLLNLKQSVLLKSVRLRKKSGIFAREQRRSPRNMKLGSLFMRSMECLWMSRNKKLAMI